MKKKLSALLLAVILLAGGLAGCQSSPDESTQPVEGETPVADEAAPNEDAPTDQSQKEMEITIYTYYAESAKEAVDAALVELEKLYPNIQFTIEHRTDADGSVLRTRAAVGELPEIMELTGALTETFVQSGDILSLSDAMEAMGFLEKFIPNVTDGSRYIDGNYYSMGPDVPENAMFFYNITVFEELGLSAPKTWTNSGLW